MPRVWLKIIGTQMYVHHIHGTSFVTWALEKDRGFAVFFPEKDIVPWMNLLESITGEKLTPITAKE